MHSAKCPGAWIAERNLLRQPANGQDECPFLAGTGSHGNSVRFWLQSFAGVRCGPQGATAMFTQRSGNHVLPGHLVKSQSYFLRDGTSPQGGDCRHERTGKLLDAKQRVLNQEDRQLTRWCCEAFGLVPHRKIPRSCRAVNVPERAACACRSTSSGLWFRRPAQCLLRWDFLTIAVHIMDIEWAVADQIKEARRGARKLMLVP